MHDINNSTERVFTWDDQTSFAALSGDYNPLHVDPIAARRYVFGKPVVHGIHALLWVLDSLFGDLNRQIDLTGVKASFVRPMGVGDHLLRKIISQDDTSAEIHIVCGDMITTKVRASWRTAAEPLRSSQEDRLPPKQTPRLLTEEDLFERTGSLEICMDSRLATRLFPKQLSFSSRDKLAFLISSSRLVGVECPGMNSIYSEIDISFGSGAISRTLDYKVFEFDPRFNKVCMNILSSGVAGSIKAFLRPDPYRQKDYLAVRDMVDRNEFAGQKALIVGGSRGLGEATAKILAAGGADVLITYHKGKADAFRIKKEIAENGGNADVLHFDVTNPDIKLGELEKMNCIPTHLYYFATPFIAQGTKNSFSTELFSSYCRYYVAGFMNTITSLKDLHLSHIFYPSTVFADEQPALYVEYVAAKMAGESMCNYVMKNRKGTSVYAPRLPRMATDQTVTLMKVNHSDPIPTMIDHIRHFSRQSLG
jgi:hypothetical protein